MLVGCTNWEVTHWNFGVHFSVSTMGRNNSAPIKVHFGAMLRILGLPQAPRETPNHL